LSKLIRVGGKSCNIKKSLIDIKKSSVDVSKSLQKILQLTKKVKGEKDATVVAKTQKKIADLLKENIKNSDAITDKANNSRKCTC
jgi:hypothetical protein